ncbi:MAG: PEP-utilizing enzyme [Candidatus Woesearchaeota archaeon]
MVKHNNWNKLLAREGVDITTISGIDKVFFKHIRKFSNSDNEYFFTTLKNKNFTHYIGINSHKLGKSLYIKYFNSPSKIKEYYQSGINLLQDIKSKSNRWKNKLTVRSDKKEFLSAFKDFKNQFEIINHVYSITSWLGIESWQNDFDKILNNLIKKRNVQEKEPIINAVYKPWKKTALNEIQEKVEKGISLEKLTKEYQFLRSWSVIWYRPIDKEWIKNVGTIPKSNIKNFTLKKVIKLLKPNKKERNLIELAPYITFFKDWRDDLRRKHSYYWRFLFDDLGEKFSINSNDFGYLTLEEVEVVILKGKIEKNLVKRRKSNQCIITTKRKDLVMEVIDINIPKKYKNIIKNVENSLKRISISGLIAEKGKVKSRVVIVNSFHDLKKVNKGDVLVANTTHPNYLPAMQRASAFVTNEGGIISHAAIVARELKKPCIVGTKNATKVFNTGDLVEVDAENGIVRKIE